MLCKQFAFKAVLGRFTALFFSFGIMYWVSKRKGKTTNNCLASLVRVCISISSRCHSLLR